MSGTLHSKVADPRYIPGASEDEDGMTDAEWVRQMGDDPEFQVDGPRIVEVVCYPEKGAPYLHAVVVDPRHVSEDYRGCLTEYLIEWDGDIQDPWRYAAAVARESVGQAMLSPVDDG